ncbi:hypothetical protein FRX31_005735 [Thalictrum thalictroides]|uniref:Root meristem growth factor n=1 Tax=Thalictrum thalictroides TaxID=46969 RepID=A0A7J6X6I6_THATH|nr:hypothetical protein FRX31_005735 [Thalictrum thalictroides]
MEFLTVFTTLCIAFSFVLINASCVSSSPDEYVHGVVDSTHTTKLLPRKLGISIKDPIVKAYVSEAFIPDINKKGTLPGRAADQTSSCRLEVDGKRGTRQKWVDAHMWQYFTMDYSRVRRRRPIHNKSIPHRP